MARVLVIADTHVPFEHPGYLGFLKKTHKLFKCNRVVHIGDFADALGFSNYDLSPDAISTNEELGLVAKRAVEWQKAFPTVEITRGNHESRIAKKFFGAGIPARFMPTYNEIFGLKAGWKFVESTEIDGVYYTHGEEGDARKACLINQQSTVSGHLHTKMGIEFYTNRKGEQIWGMQLGTGIDAKSMAFDYAKNHRPQQLGCGVVIDGSQPIIVPFIP